MELKESVYIKIRTDSDLQAKIMLAVKVSYSTVRKWAVEKNPKMLQVNILEVIKKHLGYSTYDELLKENLTEML